MKAAIIIQFIALPAIMAKLTIQIVGNPTWKDARVIGIRNEGEQEETTDASDFGNDGKVARCLDDNYVWTAICVDKPSYLKIGEFYFEKDPDPMYPPTFLVKHDNQVHQVGRTIEKSSEVKLTLQCGIEVTGGEGNYVYAVEKGFLDPDEATSNIPGTPLTLAKGVSITCDLVYT